MRALNHPLAVASLLRTPPRYAQVTDAVLKGVIEVPAFELPFPRFPSAADVEGTGASALEVGNRP